MNRIRSGHVLYTMMNPPLRDHPFNLAQNVRDIGYTLQPTDEMRGVPKAV